MTRIDLSSADRELILTALAISARQADDGATDVTMGAERRAECRKYVKQVRALADRIEA